MTDEVKRRALIFFLLTVVVVALVAAALPRLQLNPGIPMPALADSTDAAPAEQTPLVAITISTFLKAMLGVIITLLVMFGLYKVIRKADWKEVLKRFLIYAAMTVVALIILFALYKVRVNFTPLAPETLPPELKVAGPPLGPLPPFLNWLVWIGLALMAGLLALWVIRWRSSRSSIDLALRLEAERAMQALMNGMDFKNVIIQCYWQMSRVLQTEQGIERKQAMTVREFERLLEARGIPHAPIHQLTQLFETARYGSQQPDPQDEQVAFECLTAIVEHSRKVVSTV